VDAFFASPEQQICRTLLEAYSGHGSTIIRGSSETDPLQDFARSTASGLVSAPRRLECRFLYDAEGSALFERVTQQPEYYLTRTETSILAANAACIRELTGPVTLVELGSGSSAKTDFLLRAWLEQGERVCYVPVDVSESALSGACSAITAKYPRVRVIGVNYDFREAFSLISKLSPTLVLLLGSTIGNFSPQEMSRFFMTLSGAMTPGDGFLLGIDLVKDRSLLEAAYNDAAGVTANFTRNIFARMNRELGSAIDTDAIEHVATYDRVKEQIEIYARFTRQQTFLLAPLGRQFAIPPGDMVQIEISRKFRLERVLPYLEEFGFSTEEIFTDERNWFALLLLRRRPRYYSARGRGR